MLKTIEEVSPTQKRLHIEISAQAIEKEIGESLEKLRQRTRIAGFRTGRAPMSLIERKFGKEVESDVLQKLIPRVYSEAIREANLRPVDEPVSEQIGDFKRREPFNMTLLVEVMPEIKDLNYEGIKVREVEAGVQDKDVDDILERLREEKAVYEPTEGPLAEGDIAIMDYTVEGAGEEKEPKAFTSQVFRLGSGTMPADFSRALTGRKKGESLDAEVDFPDDYPVKDMAGRHAVFHVTVKDAKKAKIPALDDELAKDLGHEGLEGLRAHVREHALESKKRAVRKLQKAEIISRLLEAHEFEVPQSLVEKELTSLVEEAAARGDKPDVEALRKTLEAVARRNVKATLLLELIGEREKVEVSEEDVKAKVADLARGLSVPPENVIKYYVSRHGSLDGLRQAVFEEKVMELLLGKAQFEKVEQKQ